MLKPGDWYIDPRDDTTEGVAIREYGPLARLVAVAATRDDADYIIAAREAERTLREQEARWRRGGNG